MTQGKASSSHSGSTKVEPKSHAVNVEAVSTMGVQHHYNSVPLYAGRGLQAPHVGDTSHPSGSQGKHK